MELPQLQDLWSEVRKARSDVEFLCVNIGDEKDVIEEYWQTEEFTLKPVRQEGGVVSEAFGVRAYPTNYVIGPDGKVLYRSVGYDEKQIQKVIASTKK